MKHIKTYEAVNFKPNLYDYAIIQVIKNGEKISVVGQITNIKFENNFPYYIEIKEPAYFIDTFKLQDLECWSDSKEELEAILQSNKYNL